MKQQIILIGENGEEHIIKKYTKSQMIKNMLNDINNDSKKIKIIIPNITINIIKLAARYLEILEDREDKEDNETQDNVFIKNISLEDSFYLSKVGEFLGIDELVNISCKNIARYIRGKKPDELKKVFNINGDFTNKDKQEVYKQNAWLKKDD